MGKILSGVGVGRSGESVLSISVAVSASGFSVEVGVSDSEGVLLMLVGVTGENRPLTPISSRPTQ